MNYNVIRVEPQGYCGGVLKAIDVAKHTREIYPNEKITILGNLVHNEYVKKALEALNIQTIENPALTRLELLDCVDSGIIIFTAHGVSPAVRKKAKEKQLTIVDASCPFVLQTQKIVKERIDQGYTVFYVGKYRHPEAESVYSSSNQVYLIQNEEDIPRIHTDKIFVTNQTTMSILTLGKLFKDIQNQYPNAEIHDEICNATRVRQEAILNLKEKNVDALVVVGSATSNNTRKLAEIGKSIHIPIVIPVLDINELDMEQLKQCKNIAVTSGASTPFYLTNQVIEYIKNYPCEKEKIRLNKIL